MTALTVDNLHPEFKARAEAWLTKCTEAGLFILLTCTLRTFDEQERLYAIGRTVVGKNPIPVIRPMGRIVTNARGGQSAHQYGMALDFVPMDCGKPDWTGSGKLWDTAIELAQQQNMQSLRPMESAHLQLPNWRVFISQMESTHG